MAITHVKLLSVPVTDQDRAKDFYVDTLGFELIADNPMGPGQRWVQVGPKGAATSITLVTWFESMPAGSLTGLVLETDDLDAEVAALTREADGHRRHSGRAVGSVRDLRPTLTATASCCRRLRPVSRRGG